MRLLFYFIITLGINLDSSQEKIVGGWIRAQDKESFEKEIFEGDLIEVRYEEDELVGRLIYISEVTKNYGYHLNDLKWKNIKRINENEYEIEGLVMIHSLTGLYDKPIYVKCRLTFESNDILKSRTVSPDSRFEGHKLTFIRVPVS